MSYVSFFGDVLKFFAWRPYDNKKTYIRGWSEVWIIGEPSEIVLCCFFLPNVPHVPHRNPINSIFFYRRMARLSLWYFNYMKYNYIKNKNKKNIRGGNSIRHMRQRYVYFRSHSILWLRFLEKGVFKSLFEICSTFSKKIYIAISSYS